MCPKSTNVVREESIDENMEQPSPTGGNTAITPVAKSITNLCVDARGGISNNFEHHRPWRNENCVTIKLVRGPSGRKSAIYLPVEAEKTFE